MSIGLIVIGLATGLLGFCVVADITGYLSAGLLAAPFIGSLSAIVTGLCTRKGRF